MPASQNCGINECAQPSERAGLTNVPDQSTQALSVCDDHDAHKNNIPHKQNYKNYKQHFYYTMKAVQDYSIEEVGYWLQAIGLPSEAFTENAVDGEMLCTLTKEDLTGDLGLSSLQGKDYDLAGVSIQRSKEHIISDFRISSDSVYSQKSSFKVGVYDEPFGRG